MAKAERDVTPAIVKVRMTKLPSDLRIRLLLSRVAKKGGKPFTISGFQLRDSMGRWIPQDTLHCDVEKSVQKKSVSLDKKNLIPTRNKWFCTAGKNYSLEIKNGVRIYPEGGFIEFGGKSYRGGIEFAELESQIQIMNSIELERYLVGLLTKEMSPEFPLEALKAQAIAARSYALARAADQRRSGKNWDLVVTQSDQVYEGAHSEDPRTLAAVKATIGEALHFRNEVITAYYHAASGGFSEIPENVWGKTELVADRLAYANIDNPWDKKNLEWSASISPDFGGIWADVGILKEITVLGKTSGQRVESLLLRGEYGKVILDGSEIRKRFGNDLIKSLNFTVESLAKGSGWKISGRGWGHGVGLSQWAAKAMAESGMSYRSILKFHYPFADIKSWIPRSLPQPILSDVPPIPAALTR